MPSLDVTAPLNSPQLADVFNVIRRQEVVNSLGRLTTILQTFADVGGVVTIGGNNDLDRNPEYDVYGRGLTIVSKFKLIGSIIGFKPDIIQWRGDYFIVRSVDPYPHFGQGFYEIECQSLRNVDPDVANATFGQNGQLNFNSAGNSGYLALGI